MTTMDLTFRFRPVFARAEWFGHSRAYMPAWVLRSTKDKEKAQFDTKTHESAKRMHGDLCQPRAREMETAASANYRNQSASNLLAAAVTNGPPPLSR